MRRLSLLVLGLTLGITACAVSTQQEVEMGAGYAQQIERQLPLVEDAELTRYIVDAEIDPNGIPEMFQIEASKARIAQLPPERLQGPNARLAELPGLQGAPRGVAPLAPFALTPHGG